MIFYFKKVVIETKTEVSFFCSNFCAKICFSVSASASNVIEVNQQSLKLKQEVQPGKDRFGLSKFR
jgi:endogenous inhibitor of DNA gyrase (YacG/DUF329 family)